MLEFAAASANRSFAMDEPPFLIDGARVLAYAGLDAAGGHAVVGGVALEAATAVAIAEGLADGTTFLLFCNESWETLAAETHADVAGAQRAARAQLPSLEWRDYRALSQAEAAEIETTRAFLQELARDFPGGG